MVAVRLLLAGRGGSASSPVTSPNAASASGASRGDAGTTPETAFYPPVDNAAPPQATNIDPIVRAAAPGRTGRCDPLGANGCLFPFPNDYFTAADEGSDTWRRVHFAVASMPKSSVVLGPPVNPAEWSRNDGFSPDSGHDPHDDVERLPAARLQRSMFLRPGGRVVDVCHGGACGVSIDEGGVH